MRTFFYERRVSPQDGRRCRVCGHLSLTPVRRTFNALLLVIIGMLFA